MGIRNIYFVLPLIIVLGHIFILPMIFSPEIVGITQRFTLAEQVDLALIIAPLTSASFITVVKFAVDNRDVDLGKIPAGNALFSTVTVVVVLAFFVSIYFFIIKFQITAGSDAKVLKGLVGVVEVFFGAAYAVVVSSLFGKGVQ